MSEFKLTSVEEFEQATNELLETGAKVGADAWQFRVKNQTPHCKFGEQGTCCRICTMGPCRITPKAPRGICGCEYTDPDTGRAGRKYRYGCYLVLQPDLKCAGSVSGWYCKN